MNSSFLQEFIDGNRDWISEGTARQLHVILRSDGPSAVDEFLRNHLVNYESRLLNVLKRSVKAAASRGRYVRHVEKLYRSQPKQPSRIVVPFGF